MKTGKWINIGLIGAGRIGRLHAENLSRHIDGARLSAIADVCLETAEEIAQKFEVPMAVPDYRVLLENPAIDAVAICSATDTHSAIIEAAAEAGKDIFCEKPIDFSLQKIDLALAAVKKAGVKLQIGFNRRFDPNFQKVRQLVAAGKIGTPHLLRITSRDPAPPPLEYIKVSGGIFLDMTIHDFYMASFLMQQPVSEIYAAGSVLVDPAIGTAGDIDTAAITLRFEGGAIGVIDNSRQAVYGYDQRVEVFGSAGMVTIGNNSPDQHVYSNKEGVHSTLPHYFFLERYRESYIAEMREFVQCLQQDTPPAVSGEEGRLPVVMGLAARKSWKENRPVNLSEIDS